MQNQVAEFHRDFGLEIGTNAEFKRQKPSGFDNRLLRKRLIKEESRELCDALTKNDIVGTVDGMCDLIYVVLGTAVEMGIDLEPFFDEVHRSNMEKKTDGKVITREDGKILKPANWKPPQIAEMIKEGTGVVKDFK